MLTRTHLIRRWTAFNVVGAAGVAVQLAALALLIRVAHLHYLPATALAVEAAVLHNFFWHQRWTWKDRPAESTGRLTSRFIRFHLLNGTISLAGNVAIMAVLAGLLRMDAIAANAIAIVTCSLLNFAASERLVFRSAAAVAVLIALGHPTAVFAGPAPAGVAAWHGYEAALDARYATATAAGTPFFAQDASDQGRAWRAIVARGGVNMIRIDAPSAADARIHHWTGTVLVPGVTLDTVLARLKQAAGRESEFYDDVAASKLLERNGDLVRVFLKLRRTTLITVTYNSEHTVQYRRLGPTRASSRSVATKIAELSEAGTAAEREKPADDDNGFLWRLNAYWRYEQVPEGVLIECESVSLSRAVPYLLRPVANPLVERVARESLERTLTSLRAFLRKSG
jgi:putative flippase GtrA